VLGVDPAVVNGKRAATTDPTARRWRERVGIVLQGTGEFDELDRRRGGRHFARFYPSPDDPAA
jgi:ABC-2 type transport system ATP-binding protein